jgi:hypothetical protein
MYVEYIRYIILVVQSQEGEHLENLCIEDKLIIKTRLGVRATETILIP